jgi:hypothetical protein
MTFLMDKKDIRAASNAFLQMKMKEENANVIFFIDKSSTSQTRVLGLEKFLLEVAEWKMDEG